MTNSTIRAAMMGDVEAQMAVTEEGIALQCPFCGNNETSDVSVGEAPHWWRCEKCGSDGTASGSKLDALAAWNARSPLLPEPNEPLTLSELLEMEKATPVWMPMQIIGVRRNRHPIFAGWYLVRCYCGMITITNASASRVMSIEDVKGIIAYRRPPNDEHDGN